MKKTLTYLLVVVALVAVASSAMAVTCTIDQRPAATLLVPYFQVHLNADGSVDTSSTRTDTLITVVNASSAPTLAHVVVWNRRSIHVLDFDIALTGFDIVGFSMEDVLTGTIPSTPDNGTFKGANVCQSGSGVKVYPNANGFLRFIPTNTPDGASIDRLASTQIGSPAFGPDFAAELADELDYDANNDCDADTVDSVITGSPVSGNGNLSGYVTIDMANYCSIGFPDLSTYWDTDAAGWENNLFGDYIIVTNSGIPTLGAPTVAIEAALDTAAIENGNYREFGAQPFNDSDGFTRTFYARYWSNPISGNTGLSASGDSGTIINGTGATSEAAYLSAVFPFVSATWGDNREPLGVRYAARYLNNGTLSSNLRVWRASSGDLKDLTGPAGKCTASEAPIGSVVYDSDEGTTTTGNCVSPCLPTTHNFPYETQRTGVDVIGALPTNGWVYLNFLGNEIAAADDSQNFDQAWVDYEMSSGVAFVNASVPAVQIDPSTCYPAGMTDLDDPTDQEFQAFYPWPVGLGH